MKHKFSNILNLNRVLITIHKCYTVIRIVVKIQYSTSFSIFIPLSSNTVQLLINNIINTCIFRGRKNGIICFNYGCFIICYIYCITNQPLNLRFTNIYILC